MSPKPPKDLEHLRAEIVARHDELSPRLRQVAAFLLDHPADMGLETLAVIAERCHVQPSTIVRFAKAFGYPGASQMQRLFREELLNQAPSPSYAERIRQFAERAGRTEPHAPHELMHEFTENNIIALEHLRESVRREQLESAVRLIDEAEAIHLLGLRRSFPVAAYMAYALRHVDKRAFLIDGLGGLLQEQSSMLTKRDLLIAISFRPYAVETAEIVERARTLGARVLALTDSRVSPIARAADISFEIQDAEVRQFRSLTASLCLAQTLVISYAYHVEARTHAP